MTTHTKTFLILSTLTLTLGAGCNSSPTINNTDVANSNSMNTVVTQNDNGNNNVNQGVDINVDTSDLSVGAAAQEDWKKYTNEEYGFSFEYPKEWILEEKNRNSCVGLLTKERYIERTQVLDQIRKDGGGTDAVPGNHIMVCLREENVTTDVISWGDSNVKKYVDEVYRGESELNTLTAYLVIDLDFGESKNYYVKSNNNIYSVYYEEDVINADINKIINSLKF